LPYGKTDNKWDNPIDLESFWSVVRRIRKKHGVVAGTASNGYEYVLHASNPKEYRYKWVWHKVSASGFANAKRRPLNVTEDVLIFGHKNSPYYPLMEERGKPRRKGAKKAGTSNYGGIKPTDGSVNNLYYPKSLITFSNAVQLHKINPTEKPAGLVEYLIKTYTKEGDLVADLTFGSATTAIACLNTNRRFVGCELYPLQDRAITDRFGDNPDHYHSAVKRVLEYLDKNPQLRYTVVKNNGVDVRIAFD
jgi:site-specific DNA-methyltransferase (adenine-specific)